MTQSWTSAPHRLRPSANVSITASPTPAGARTSCRSSTLRIWSRLQPERAKRQACCHARETHQDIAWSKCKILSDRIDALIVRMRSVELEQDVLSCKAIATDKERSKTLSVHRTACREL